MRFLVLDRVVGDCETLVIGGKNFGSLAQRKGNSLHLYLKKKKRFKKYQGNKCFGGFMAGIYVSTAWRRKI